MSGRSRRDPRVQFLVVVILLILAIAGKYFESTEPQVDPAVATIDEGHLDVLRVVDGDTLLIKKNRTRVRLQGIDTPETVKEDTPVQPWGPEATAYTKQFIREAGQNLSFTIDGEQQDQYGRSLRFVWNGDRLLNEELVAQGLARAKLAYDYSQSMKTRLRKAQDEARRERRGIWSPSR